jgi:acetyl-CoA acetyltransferase
MGLWGVEPAIEPNLNTTGAKVAAEQAYRMAGFGADQVDLVETSAPFTFLNMMVLEDLGFCAKGEGGAFVEGGRLAPGGALPALTSGGGLSYNHPGAFGLLLLVEAVRQLRGEAGDRQVPGAGIAVAHGVGGLMSTASTVVLGND